MSWSIVQALHSVPMLLTNLCKYVFLTRYPMLCHTHLPQTEYDEKKPACREEAHSGLAQGQTSLIEEHHGIEATGVRFSRCRMPKCRLHARSSWCGMQGFVVVPRFDLESCGSCGMINLWMLAWPQVKPDGLKVLLWSWHLNWDHG